MARTDLHKISVQEKLNSMDIDIIDVAVDTDADASGELLITTTEIPNAVAVNGGTAILQSAMFMSNKVLTDSIDVVITSDSTSQGSIGDTVSGSSVANTVMDGTCGFFTISNLFDAGAVAIGSKNNIGMVCKAEADSTSLWVILVAESTDDYDGNNIVVRLGFVKD